MNGTTSITISQLRQGAAQAIQNVVSSQTPTVIYQHSKPTAVLVDVTYYQALEEAVLDLTDAREIEKASHEPTDTFDSYVKKRWKSRV